MALVHRSVLLEEAVAALMATHGGQGAAEVYVDGTFGRGGHAAAILASLQSDDALVAFDKDPAAEAAALDLAESDERFRFIRDSFAEMQLAGTGLAGVLLDLGVSSPQLDDPDRGFSFAKDGPLDMRMDNAVGETAADFVNAASEAEMTRVFREYGEERFARRIAAAIAAARKESPFTSTSELADVVSRANPAWEKHKHPATRVFQAIRIHVNRELADLELVLAKVVDLMRIGGRLVVISFHSLEDRMVKRFLRAEARGNVLPRGVPVRGYESGARLRLIGGSTRASDLELAENPRARSAIMRVAERVA